jgi:hypothetical protein
MTNVVLRLLSPSLRGAVLAGRPAVDSARTAAAGVAAAVALQHPSERMLMEQLDYNLIFRWFVGLAMELKYR